MKILGAALISTLVVMGSLASSSAEANGGRWHRGGGHHAHHGHGHGHHGHGPRLGFFIGAPLVAAPWWYYSSPSYYYAPPAYYSTPPATIEYVERGQAAPAQQQNWWYYCQPSQAYYPYVKECSTGWQRVAPQPPQSQ